MLYSESARPSFDPPDEYFREIAVVSLGQPKNASSWTTWDDSLKCRENEFNELSSKFKTPDVKNLHVIWMMNAHKTNTSNAWFASDELCYDTKKKRTNTCEASECISTYRIFIFGLSKVSFIIQSSHRKSI